MSGTPDVFKRKSRLHFFYICRDSTKYYLSNSIAPIAPVLELDLQVNAIVWQCFKHFEALMLSDAGQIVETFPGINAAFGVEVVFRGPAGEHSYSMLLFLGALYVG